MKNNIFKKITMTGLVAVSIVSFNSCGEDWLDERPIGRAPSDAVGGQEALVIGLYSSLRTQGGVSDFTYVWTHCIRADDNEKGSSATDAAADGTVFNNFGYVASNGHIRSDWDGHYKIIYDANEIINTAEASGDVSDATLVNVAEAKAIRAFCYFELRRDFGEVPVNLKTIDVPADEIAPKNTVAEVDTQIEKDLIEAAAYLPENWASVYVGRATKGFANTVLAKLYLYQGQWTKSLEKSQEVISSGVYVLSPSYDFEFTQEGNNSTESILEVQRLYNPPLDYKNNFYESQGVRGSGIWDLGWGFNVPSTELVNVYETGDLRKQTTILVSGGPDIYNTPNLVLPASPPLDQQYWNGKAYTYPSERLELSANKNYWENIKLLRYADVLLMAAEAANELGQTGTATTYINMIRTRAGLGNTTAVSQLDMRNAIKHERRVEFAMEFERFYDLVRWGDAVTVLASKGYQHKNRFFPIPQTAIDNAQGVLVQNPDY